MGTRIDDVYYCQMDRTTELSNKMSNRNIPSKQLRPIYFSRAPFNSRGIVFPMLDCTKRTKVKKAKFPPYDQKTTFNPGYRGSYDGYANNANKAIAYCESLGKSTFQTKWSDALDASEPEPELDDEEEVETPPESAPETA